MKLALKVAVILIGIPLGSYVMLWAVLGLMWLFEFPWAYNSNWHW